MDENKKFSTEEADNVSQKKSEQSKLDALLYNMDEENQYTDEEEDFDSFMAEYRTLISNISHPMENEEEDDPLDDGQEEFLISLPKSQESGKKKKEASVSKNGESDWDKITLAPEEYADLEKEDEPLMEEPAEEEPQPDFDLGEKQEESEDKFQLSIKFDGERKEARDDEEEKPAKEYDPEHPRAIDNIFDIVEMFVYVLVAVILITSLFFRHSIVDGDSMNNTLSHGDHLIISDFLYEPDYYDIVVFEDYSVLNQKKALIKRVVALPGDTVEIKLDNEGRVTVYVNGEPLPEEYAYNSCDRYLDTSSFNKPIQIGEDEVFVMGDNRYNSHDSRSFGAIKIDSILGKSLIRIYPFDSFGVVE